MNAQFHKVIFSKRLGTLVAVGEHASAQGKSASGEGARGAVLAAAVFLAGLSSAYALDPSALPSGHQVAAGQVQVTTSGARMDIGQFTDKAIVNWQNFNVGSGASVQIHQPSAASVLLNRVVGNEMSQIRGQISANGQVVLVNPNGIVMGPTGRITASAFTASTFGISDANFLAGQLAFERNGSNASVVNEGSIQTTGEAGGYVALIGASVSNQGTIASQGAGVALASGERATVSVPLSGKVRLELDPAAFGSASVSNSGVIQTSGGQVFMRAAAVVDAVSKIADARVTHTGTIDTTGTQGGRVDVLSDHGTVRVSGNVKANSTSGAAGGDVYIGRDEHTNTLAAIGDASGATLESQGGFVETSGKFLKVDDININAKDWLLDPTDIRIVASNTATQDTAQSTSGNTTTFQDSTAVGVTEVHKATIEAAINNGTNVTITTANAPGSGEGNITIETALSFNNTGAQAATLTLLAQNGITQNSGASITATGTQSVHVVMEAQGRWAGQDADSTSSQGITLNSTITTNGNVTLTGTSRNTFGVQTGPTYSWGATNNSRSGVVFNGGSGITADNFQITGTHNVATGDSFGINGVFMSGAVNLVSTGNTNSTITGISNAQGNFGAGVMVWDGATVRLENRGTGVTTLRGSNTHAGGGNGVRIGASVNSAVINAVGRVTLGQQTAGVNAPIFIRGTLNASLNTSNLGGLTILGQTGSGLTTTAVQLWDTNVNAAGVDLVIDGIAGNATGVYIQTAPNTTWTTKNLTVTGVANTTSGSSGSGVVIQRYPNVLTVNASGNIAIEGTVQGAGNGRGLYFAESGWGPQAHRLSATGNVTLRGNNRASTSNTSHGVSIVSGVQVSAGGNIVLQGETNNAAATAIFANSSGNFADWTAAANSGSGALNGNLSLRSTSGDVLIQSNQGSIVLNNQLTSTLINGSQTTSTDISGRNITIDNTGAGMATGTGTAVTGTGGTQGAVLGSGSIDTLTGVITRGTGKSTSSTAGVRIADGRAVTAKNYINIFGAGTTGSGVEISGAAALSANVVGFTGNINIAGENTSSSGAAINISNAASTITARNIATLTSSGTGSGTSLVAAGNITVGGELQVENPATATISGVISGTGMLRKRGGTGTGTLTLTGNNTYLGGTTANGGTLQVGNGGTVGSLGTGAISIASVLNINRSDTYTIADNISGTGQLWQTGAGTTVLTGTNSYSGNTLVNAGILQVGNGGTTGTLGTSSVALSNTRLYFVRSNDITASNTVTGTGHVHANSSGGSVTLSNLALTANLSASAAGNISITNNGGTLTVNDVNGVSGVSAQGNISLSSTSSSGHGLYLLRNVTAPNGDVNLVGSTSSTTSSHAGVMSSATVSGRDIAMVANATANTGSVLGYYGAGGQFIASGDLNLTGSSSNASNGLYSYGGRFESTTGMTLTGTSAQGNAVGMDANLTLINRTSGGISVTGTSTDSTKNAISLRGTSFTNGGGSISLDVMSGHFFADAGSSVWGLGALTNTLTQNGSGDVTITTQNSGNLTVPIIVNNGSGDVIIAAGSNLLAGNGSGGQVLTVSGNTITQNGSGKTYVYTGQASATGQLSHLNSAFNTLYYQGSSHTLNAQFNTAYSNTIAGGASAQVLFRDTTAPSFSLSLNNISKTYGDADPTLAARNTALLSAYTGLATLTTTVNGANSGSNTFAVSAADVINGLTGTGRTAGTHVGTYAYTDVSGSAFNTTLSAQPSLVIAPRDITLTSITAATKVYDGNTVASITGGTFGNIVAGETLLLGGSGYFNSANVNGVSTVTVDDITTLTKPTGGTGLWSNYNLTSTGAITSNATGKITPATLTATVNDSSIYVTQLASTAPDMGVSYSGFVNGETSAVLTGSAVRSYTGSASYPAAGTYAGVFGLSQTPTSGNYQISVVAGDLTVVPADKLLITIQSQSTEYGSQTAANLGTAGLGTVTAQYCFDQTNCNGANLVDLTLSKLSATRWKAEDNTGSHVVFDTSLVTSSYSTGGYLEVGNYSFNATEISPLSLYTNGQPNFTGRAVNAGVLTVEAKTLTPSITASSKDFDGNTTATIINSTSGMTGDLVSLNYVSAAFDSANAGSNKTVTVSGLSLSGADATNYRLASPSFTTTANIRSTTSEGPAPLPPVIKPVVPVPTVLPSHTVTADQANGNDNPFSLSIEPNACRLNNLSACECETNPLDESLEICYWPHQWSPSEKQARR